MANTPTSSDTPRGVFSSSYDGAVVVARPTSMVLLCELYIPQSPVLLHKDQTEVHWVEQGLAWINQFDGARAH